MSTLGALVQQTRRHLFGGGRVDLHRLGSPVSDTTTTQVTLDSSLPMTGVTRGTVLCVGLEAMLVWSANTNVITVERGWLGTTPQIHATGAVVEVNPRFGTPMILDALGDEIRSWAPRLYRVVTDQLAVNALGVIELPAGYADALGIVEVMKPVPGGTYATVRGARLVRQVPGVASQTIVQVPGGVADAASVLVSLARPFAVGSPLALATTLVSMGVPQSAWDIAPFGAAWRLMSPQEVRRTDPTMQGQTRLPEEVPPGHLNQTARELKRLRDVRLDDEARALYSRHPVRSW